MDLIDEIIFNGSPSIAIRYGFDEIKALSHRFEIRLESAFLNLEDRGKCTFLCLSFFDLCRCYPILEFLKHDLSKALYSYIKQIHMDNLKYLIDRKELFSIILSVNDTFIEKLPNCNMNYIAQRIKTLFQFAPQYFKKYAKKYYEEILSSRKRDEMLSHTNITVLLESLDATMIPWLSHLSRLSNISRYLLCSSNEIAVYFLSFELHPYVAQNLNTEKNLSRINTEFILLEAKRRYEELVSQINQNGKFKIVNEKNTLQNYIYEYAYFDIIPYIDNSFVYFFTRDEFPALTKMKKNFYTGKALNEYIYLVMNYKKKVATLYKLPECETLSDLIENLCESSLNSESNNASPPFSLFSELPSSSPFSPVSSPISSPVSSQFSTSSTQNNSYNLNTDISEIDVNEFYSLMQSIINPNGNLSGSISSSTVSGQPYIQVLFPSNQNE
jgi:hypothetical protein